jgi:integrase
MSLNPSFAYSFTRQVCAIQQGAKNLDTTTQTKTVVGDEKQTHADLKGKLVEYLWHLKKQGYSEETVKTRAKLLTQLVREGTDLFDPEGVKKSIAAHETWGNGHKQIVVHAYNGFTQMTGITWKPPVYIHDKSLPFIPLEKEIDALISGCSKKIAVSLQLLKETGMRIGEAWKLRWTDLDEEQNTIRCRA